ncbi:hypothetical protein NESM_000085400 [Novymonas esmeraldas]|uniref:Uncharacterized protein n=1 Tax=Novymonas esmeraldas TaxID=1808958 RepID=A0AAW0F4G8_9TRYP
MQRPEVAMSSPPSPHRAVSEVRRPVVLEADPDTNVIHFPPQIDFDLSSPNNVARRRRGRFVIKMAAALYLATLPAYDTPSKCSEAVSYLWGHTRLAQEYLQRTRPRISQLSLREEAATATATMAYTSQQLRVAEGKWKAHLGEQVLCPDGFQKSWDELVPFFARSLLAMERDQASGASGSVSTTTASPTPASTVTVASEDAALHGQPRTPASPASGPTADSGTTTATTTITAAAAEPLLDLSKVPARALSILYDKTVRHLRLVLPERCATPPHSTAEQRHLASRGWLSLQQILSEIHADLVGEPALKALWMWMWSINATQRAGVYLALLTTMNAVGKLQLLHDGGWSSAADAAAVTTEAARAAPVTHLRAAWGHKDAGVAAAVMREHTRVPLRSLAPPDSRVGGAGSDAAGRSSWYEYVEDVRVFRRELASAGGRVYPEFRPVQVLLPASIVDALRAPLAPICRDGVSSLCGVLAHVALRTGVRDAALGDTELTVGVGGSAGASAKVTCMELAAMLDPGSSYCLAAFVAAMTGPSARLALFRVTPSFFAAQSDDVVGWFMPLHMLRVHHDAVDEAAPTAVAAPGASLALLVHPYALTHGVIARTAATATSAAPSALASPSMACVVGVDSIYCANDNAPSTSIAFTVVRPLTEHVPHLRIASLWDLWCSSGVRAHAVSRTTTITTTGSAPIAAADAAAVAPLSPLCLMVEEALHMPAPPSRRDPPSPTRAAVPGDMGAGDGVVEHTSASAAAAAAPPAVSTVSPHGAELGSTAADDDDGNRPSPLMHHLPWELFPAMETEKALGHLDSAYRAELRHVIARWRSWCIELLQPPRRGGGSSCGCGDAGASVALREEALWDGLPTWMERLEMECALPSFSLLLPSDVPLVASSATGGEVRRLCSVGRRRALAALRRLTGLVDGATVFFIASEPPQLSSAVVDVAAHPLWLMEDDGPQSPSRPRRGDGGRDVTVRPEVLLAASRTREDEVEHMYLRQPCVMMRARRSRAPALDTGADAAPVRHVDPAEEQPAALRLCRFVCPPGSPHDGSVCCLGAALKEVPAPTAMRNGHGGCRVTPLVCDELELGAAWPAEDIVEHAVLPPLQAALEVYCARKAAMVAASGDGGGDERRRLPTAVVPDATVVQLMVDDLRRELQLVLTDEAAMEMSEFYGDALVDYCAAIMTVSCRFTSSDRALWRGGNITGSTTNAALVAGVLPPVLRRYWMSRRRIHNGKRLADCVESLFGALVKALWVFPLQRARASAARGSASPSQLAASTAAGTREHLAPPPDADMLVYVAAALLALLSGPL